MRQSTADVVNSAMRFNGVLQFMHMANNRTRKAPRQVTQEIQRVNSIDIHQVESPGPNHQPQNRSTEARLSSEQRVHSVDQYFDPRRSGRWPKQDPGVLREFTYQRAASLEENSCTKLKLRSNSTNQFQQDKRSTCRTAIMRNEQHLHDDSLLKKHTLDTLNAPWAFALRQDAQQIKFTPQLCQSNEQHLLVARPNFKDFTLQASAGGKRSAQQTSRAH